MIRIMQGDQYAIPVDIRSHNGSPVEISQVECIEISIGEITKKYPGEVTREGGRWLFPITQEESASLTECSQIAQVRVKFTSGDVVGTRTGLFLVENSQSKEVL